MNSVLLRHLRPAPLVVLSVLLGLLAGCGPSGPKTYPVQGKVVTAKAEDQKRLQGKGIEFQSTTEPNTRAFGVLQADGSFTVSTYRLGATAPGAIEGTHKARLQIDMASDEDNPTPKKKVTVDRKYTRFETSGWEITVPTTGEVLLKMP
jgi:hypothetical protein